MKKIRDLLDESHAILTEFNNLNTDLTVETLKGEGGFDLIREMCFCDSQSLRSSAKSALENSTSTESEFGEFIRECNIRDPQFLIILYRYLKRSDTAPNLEDIDLMVAGTWFHKPALRASLLTLLFETDEFTFRRFATMIEAITIGTIAKPPLPPGAWKKTNARMAAKRLVRIARHLRDGQSIDYVQRACPEETSETFEVLKLADSMDL